MVQGLVAHVYSKSLGDGRARTTRAPSLRVCYHSSYGSSCVSLTRVEHVILNIIIICVVLHICVSELFVVPDKLECKFLVKVVCADGHCSFRALACFRAQ
jgi:hypothetical protein